jgi:hypothetical protein
LLLLLPLLLLLLLLLLEWSRLPSKWAEWSAALQLLPERVHLL